MRPTRVYLGEENVNIHNTEFAMYSKTDWILLWIEKYKHIWGEHHKNWLIDQIARISHGTKVIVKLAKWGDGTQEYRFILDTPTKEYLDFVEKMNRRGVYSKGIAP